MAKQTYAWKADKNRNLDRFAEKMSKWGKNGFAPEFVDQDMIRTLDLQKERLAKKGITTDIEYTPTTQFDGTVVQWKDVKYSHKRESRNCRREQNFYYKGKKVYRNVDRGYLYVVTTDGNYEEVVEDDAYFCPACGYATKIRNLRNGCEQCGKQFKVSDLFPKITNYMFVKEIMKNDRELYTKIVFGIYFLSFVICFCVAMYGNADVFIALRVLMSALVSVFITMFTGTALLLVALIIWTIYIFVRVLSVMPSYFKTKYTKNKMTSIMKNVYPTFSYAIFEGHVISMIRMIFFR